MQPTTKLTLTLEWFLNPDHLPFIAGIATDAYKQSGLDITIIEPDDHYDGFAELQHQSIDLHINEPIHLFEHYAPNLRALGCFFETDGGIVMRQSSMDKLKNNQPIRICTPAAEDKTNRIGFEILARYAKKNNFTINRENVSFVSKDFYHIQNLQQDPSLDGAWLCFYNFEGIEALHEGMDFVFIDQHLAPYPNFSALEILTTDEIYTEKKEAIDTFIKVTNDMVIFCQNEPASARSIYYDYSKTEADALMNSIIADTLGRFITPIKPSADKWQALREMLAEIDIVTLTDKEYQSLWRL
ncbi:ABC transporter substrate-binding protein [uncultured Psychrobacter sp.]|uniref:ABC transporter substrate-binding protein n=1 Tax=uncultured Psychrobacter sp. TaxID=259303 RepID=UPI00345B367E